MKAPILTKISAVAFSAAISIGSLQAGTTNTNSHKEHGFDNNNISPFEEDQGFSNNQIGGEGMSFTSSTISGNRLKITWKESEYDGSRRERGHELKLGLTDDEEIYSGFYWNIPSGQNNNILNKNTIIWQMYCWNSAGCSNWTAHVELKSDDDLYVSHRGACVSPTVTKLINNVKTNTDYAWTFRVRTGAGNGIFEMRQSGNRVYRITNASIGFGSFSGTTMRDAVIGVKMGMYCFDTSNYSNNEKRILYLENLGNCRRSGSVTNSHNKIDPRRF